VANIAALVNCERGDFIIFLRACGFGQKAAPFNARELKCAISSSKFSPKTISRFPGQSSIG
jgi:hypothetical protein